MSQRGYRCTELLIPKVSFTGISASMGTLFHLVHVALASFRVCLLLLSFPGGALRTLPKWRLADKQT